MAIETLVPPLPQELNSLFIYLLRRDGGQPENPPAPLRMTTQVSLENNMDELEWAPGTASSVGRNADGFVLYYNAGFTGTADTASPSGSQILLAPTATKHTLVWPVTLIDPDTMLPVPLVRSYAIAAFRSTYRGLLVTAQRTIPEWIGLT